MADKEIAQFERWLKEKYELLEGEICKLEAHEAVPYRAAELVREASEMARRLGAGHLAVSRFEFYQGGEVCGIHDAKSVIGRMLHWCREQEARTGGLDNGSDEGPFSVEQVAQLLRVSKGKVYELCKGNLIGHERVGRRIVISADDLKEYRSRVKTPSLDLELPTPAPDSTPDRAPARPRSGYRHL